jgi:hypothetical protein
VKYLLLVPVALVALPLVALIVYVERSERHDARQREARR